MTNLNEMAKKLKIKRIKEKKERIMKQNGNITKQKFLFFKNQHVPYITVYRLIVIENFKFYL